MLFRSLLVLIAVLVVGACGTNEPAGLEGFDTSTITIDELIVAVNNGLRGCDGHDSVTLTPTGIPTPTLTPIPTSMGSIPSRSGAVT